MTLSTRVTAPMTMPGMPNLPMMGGRGGGTERVVAGRAVYDQKAVEPIYLTVPADLKLANNRLVLTLPKSEVGQPGQPGRPDEPGTGGGNMEITNKLYWHPDVAQGPVTETFKIAQGKDSRPGMPGMSMPDLSRIVSETAGKEADGSESKLPAQVVGQGTYVLNTGGQAVLDGFLPPIKVTGPEMGKVKLEQAITVTWQPVQGARGYLLSASGTSMDNADENNTKMTLTSWFSTLNQPPMRIRGGYVQETTIADDLRDGILLPASTTSCTIPPAIFKGCMFLNLKLEAIGNDFYSREGGITVRGTIRSEWTAMAMFMNMGGEE